MALKYFGATVLCLEKYRENKISKVVIFINGYKLTEIFFLCTAQTVNAVLCMSGKRRIRG